MFLNAILITVMDFFGVNWSLTSLLLIALLLALLYSGVCCFSFNFSLPNNTVAWQRSGYGVGL